MSTNIGNNDYVSSNVNLAHQPNVPENTELIHKVLSQGISIIPVRDKEESGPNGRIYPAKSPYGRWEQNQKQRNTKDELQKQMTQYNTQAVAAVCGEISGNLETLDIDEKHKLGFSAVLLNLLKELYPGLHRRLRICRTPSNGIHISYKIIGHKPPGSLKLAGRYATDEELSKKPKEKVKYFIETRGEAAYALIPPSSNYQLINDVPYQEITWDERESLINLCKSFNEIIKVDKPITLNNKTANIYDENPFDDFNNRCNPTDIITEFGYTAVKQNAKFVWFTRPGGTKGNIHLSYNRENGFFMNFSSNSELEEKGYTPANLLAVLKFGGDKKKLYAYLVENGFGKIKPAVEREIAKKAAINGSSIQANLSVEARKLFDEEVEKLGIQHPHGTFWETDEDDKINISRERLYSVAFGLGFRLHNDGIVQIIDKFIYTRNERFFFDALKDYIIEEDADIYEDICNAYESFVQRSGAFTITRLALLAEDCFLKDTRQCCNKFFRNGYLTITTEAITFSSYDVLSKLVFFDRIQQRDYEHYSDGKYVQYLDFAIGINDYLRRIIGFLCHEVYDDTMAYMIVLTEQATNPKDGGGSGKNIFGKLLKYTTTFVAKPGSQAKFDEKFFQTWNSEKIFCIQDLPENFDFAFLKDTIGGSFVWKKLYKDEAVVDVEDSPKLMASTNFSYEVSDGGLKRRIIPIEFTDFFTKAGGVDTHFGGTRFPQDWAPEDWNGYDTFIAQAIQKWIQCGLKLTPAALSKSGWEKQFIQTYNQTAFEILSAHWSKWVAAGYVSNDDFKKDLENYYIENATTNDRFKLSPQKLNAAITEWGVKYKFSYEKHYIKKGVHNIPEAGKRFTSSDTTPF